MNKIKTILLVFPLFFVSVFAGCTTVKYYPANFVESLKHPTKFPDVFSFEVLNIEELVKENPLGEDEEVKVTDVGENKNSSMHLIQVNKNSELPLHYHKRHDVVIYVKKGSGIAMLDGTRYMIKPGSMLQIPGKTVHKILNTGGETFVAISIFSPPFDGRDEIMIQKKKKIERTKREERRIARKQSEKKKEEGKEETEVNAATSLTSFSEAKTIGSESVATSQPENEFSDYDFVDNDSGIKSKPVFNGKQSLKERKEGGERSVPQKSQALDIKDLHEKLSKLSLLREEGAISEMEYENMKDALIRGKDVGALPEPEGFGQKKKPTEDPILKEEETYAGSKDEFFYDNQQEEESSYFYTEKDVEYQDREQRNDYDNEKYIESEEASSGYKLKLLEEMRLEGLISDADYAEKKRELSGHYQKETASVLSSDVITNNKLRELKELYNEGLITEEDYSYKLSELTDVKTDEHISDNDKETEPANEKILELEELYQEGLITEDDYRLKMKELKELPSVDFSMDTYTEKELDNEKVLELKELFQDGLITEEDYNLKLKELKELSEDKESFETHP
ncbi:MAG: SHOCT domain-containing protein [Candidatus Brocadiaceae bacterium]|nr:SHOCT domain-containing protein [Candidatus Brocadiaceae bacterium]